MSTTSAPSQPGATHESKAQRVYRELSEGIMRGKYSPGYRLVLSRLAEDHAVSPVPVREAVRRLEAEGLVTHTRNVGFEVAGVDPARYFDAMGSLAIIEGAATALAAPHITSAELDAAQAINEQMRTLDANDPVRFTTLNEEFHRTLTTPCPNEHLLELLQREWRHIAQLRRSSFTRIPSRARDSVAEHDRILTLLREGVTDVRELEREVREHTLRTRDMFLERMAAQRGAAQV